MKECINWDVVLFVCIKIIFVFYNACFTDISILSMTHTHTHTHIYIYIYIYIYMYVRMYLRIYVWMYVCFYTSNLSKSDTEGSRLVLEPLHPRDFPPKQSDWTNRNIFVCVFFYFLHYLFFYCSQLVSNFGHRQEKGVCEELFFQNFFRIVFKF